MWSTGEDVVHLGEIFYESRESRVIGHVLLRDDTEMWNVPDLEF